MKLLLDTHTVLLFMDDSPRLSRTAGLAIAAEENEVLLSAVVPWEIAVKRGLGKLTASDDYLEMVSAANAVILPITLDHAMAVETLPPLHHDLFDRLLIAQAQLEGAVLVTDDPRIRQYPVGTLW